jgi:acyl dehydratase
MSARDDRPTIPFQRIEPGEPVGSLEYELSPEFIERHLRATGQEPYADPSIAPISILAAEGVNLADRFWDISESVHAGQQLEVLALPRVGDVLSVTGVARDKFVKRGRRYVVAETNTRNARGEPIARGVVTGVIVYSEGDGSGGGASPARATDPPARALATLGPLVRTMTHEAMVLYEPAGEQNIHTNDEVARQAGLPGSIATGTLFLAYVFDLLHQSYGDASRVGTSIDVRIRLPVFAGNRLETTAEVLSRDAGRIEHAVRIAGPLGDVIVGRASVRSAGGTE